MALVAIAVLAVATLVSAEPYRPHPDLVVLRVDATQASAQSIGSLDEALRLAQTWIDTGRRTGQPRPIGRGEALLQNWSTRATGSARWHVLVADIHQYRHDYPRAIGLLDRALSLDPRNSRALLMRAAVHQAQGEFQASRRDCAALIGAGENLVGTACLAQVLGFTGNLDRAAGVLEWTLGESPEALANPVRTWILSALADMQERRGDFAAAERRWREALEVEPGSLYLRFAFADFLLLHGRPAHAADTLSGLPASQGTLIRLAEADRALGSTIEQAARQLHALIAEGQQRGERLDQRDIARLALLEGRGCDAVAAARANWETQREPFDLRLLVASAVACNDADALTAARHWQSSNRYQDVVLEAMLREKSVPTRKAPGGTFARVGNPG